MIVNAGPYLPVPARRVERTARTDQRAGEERRQPPAHTPAPHRDQSQPSRDEPRTLSAREASAGAVSWLHLNAGPVQRGLRAEAGERRRYRETYARASTTQAPAPRPRVERCA